MTIGTNWHVGTPSASIGDYVAHDTIQQQMWRESYDKAAEAAKDAAFYQALQAVVIAGLQAAASDHAADKQWDIANRQMSIAEEEYDRYKDHFICNEHLLADEACALTVPVADYSTRANRAAVDVRRRYTDARRSLMRSASRYCMHDVSHALGELADKEARAVAAARDAAYRYEEDRALVLSDNRFNRAIQVANIGRGIQGDQLNTYSGAMQMANNSIGTRLSGINNFLGAVSGGISGLVQANLAARISPSPFTGSIAQGGPNMAYVNPYNFGMGGPTPMGAGAGTTGYYGGGR